MSDLPARTTLGAASAAVTLARDLQDQLRSAYARVKELEREVRDLRQQLAAANLCIGKRSFMDDDAYGDEFPGSIGRDDE